MRTGTRRLGAVAAIALAANLAACGSPSRPRAQAPLTGAAQRAAAEKLAAAFAGACLTEREPTLAIRALQAGGWPAFNTVWRDASGVFYAAPPSPAGLFVIGDEGWGGIAHAERLTCVGHYPAATAAPMVAAIAGRWGPGAEGAGPYRGARVWAFRLKARVRMPMAAARGPSPEDAVRLAPDETQVWVQVSHNPALEDVASLIAVSRRSP